MKEQDQAEPRLYGHTHQLFRAHEKLLSDANRNRALYRALKKQVTPDLSVLDIGSGSGIWAIAAARLGAKRVVAVEQDPLLIGLIKTLASENGVRDRVEALQGDSRQVELGNEFDIIISETIGNLGFDEQIVPIMIDARERFLRPGGILIPRSVALVAAAANLKGGHKKIPAGIPVEAGYFESLNLNMPVVLSRKSRLKMITGPADLARTDLTTVNAPPDLNDLTACWDVLEASQVNCFVVWAEAALTKEVGITTMETTSWSPTIYKVQPFNAERGEIEFRLTLTSATNYWTATLSSGQNREVQSYSPAFAAAALLALTRADIDLSSSLKRTAVIDVGRESEP